MKISKHVHSCLLIEEGDLVILTDPGHYTFEEGALDINSINKLDYLLITHEHADHMYIPLIKRIKEKFPDVKIVSNPSVAEILGKENIIVQTNGDENIQIQEVPHEKIFMGPSPENFLFNILGKITHPGDSHHFSSTLPILALPIQAPWGSTTKAVELATTLKPKFIIPIHDWHWNEEARVTFYKRLEEYFKNLGIKFFGLKTGEQVEI